MPSSPSSDSLSPEKLQLFIAGLAGLPKDEIRKAKILYLRNAISELKALGKSNDAMGCVQMCFMIIPLFWPFIYAQRKAMAAAQELAVERIRNAIETWQDDLDGAFAHWEDRVP